MAVELGFTVKTVKGHKYVYQTARVDGKKVTIYVGSLEEIALHYIAAKKVGITVIPRRSYRKIVREVAKIVFEELARMYNSTGSIWCGGWDLNPRRPTPSGPEPDPFDLARAPPPKYII